MNHEMMPVARDAAPILAKLFDSFAPALVAKASGVAKAITDALVADFKLGFNEFLETSYRKCHVVKTLLSQDEPLPLLDLYVNLKLQCGTQQHSDDGLISILDQQKHVVVTGLAGCGKSMFMKYLTICKFENSKGAIPIFVELRQINALTTKDLMSFIFSCATVSANNRVTRDQFDLALKAGAILLILDGFDEVEYTSREFVSKQILELSVKYPDTTVVVSSRPDDRFGAWNTFFVYKVCELAKTQVLSLIDKIDYEREIKARFRKEVDRRLYASHKSFLSSPLLASIMLLTYEQFAEIPNKMHVFYELAFDTLFRRHDAQKAQFIRKTHSGLPIDDFKRFFAAFCAMSYLEEKFSLSEVDLKRFAQCAIDFSHVVTRSHDVILDLRSSVCMLQQDGLDTVFVHRSFQEYFASLFVSTYHAPNCEQLIDRFALRSGDSVMPMLLEMAREKVEQEWVLPKLAHLLAAFEDAKSSLSQQMNAMLPMIQIDVAFDRRGSPVANFRMATTGENFRLCNLLSKLYGESDWLYRVLIDEIQAQATRALVEAKIHRESDKDEIISCLGMTPGVDKVSIARAADRKLQARRDSERSRRTEELIAEITVRGFNAGFAECLRLDAAVAAIRRKLEEIQADINARLARQRDIVALVFQSADKLKPV